MGKKRPLRRPTEDAALALISRGQTRKWDLFWGVEEPDVEESQDIIQESSKPAVDVDRPRPRCWKG